MEHEGLVTVYEETEDYKATFQEAGGHIFVHLDVYNWTPAILRNFKNKFPDLIDHVKSKGYTILFTYSKKEQSTKFWNMMKPCTQITKFGPENKYYLGAWDLEE